MTQKNPRHRRGQRLGSLSAFLFLALLVALPLGLPGQAHAQTGDPPADDEAAMRWWDELTPQQRAAALHGDEPTADQRTAAANPYADLDAETKGLVNDTAEAIDGDGEAASVGAWWWGLDCRLRRVAAGDGNTDDPDSPYCAHYPGSGMTPLLGDAEKSHVDRVGQALLGRMDPGVYPRDIPPFMGWWNALEPAQRVAALHGDSASPEQRTAAEPMYGDLDPETKRLVHTTASGIYGTTRSSSVGAWWERLNCRRKRVAVGEGNTEDTNSPYCAHYPGSGRTPLLGDAEKARVDEVGQALLERMDPGVYPPDIAPAMRWWDALDPTQRVLALHGSTADAGTDRLGSKHLRRPRTRDQETGQRHRARDLRRGQLRQRRRLVAVSRLPPQARRHGRRQHRRCVQPLLRPLSRFRPVADTRRHAQRTRQHGGYGVAGPLRSRRVSAAPANGSRRSTASCCPRWRARSCQAPRTR